MGNIIILLFIVIIIIHLFGYFKTESYPRYTTVRRHQRRGSNGVRQHQRRITDGVRFKWIPYNEMLLITLYKKIFRKK